MRVFLNLIEAIALQEDVKYFTLNGNQLKANQGRINNLITTAGVIRYLGHLEPISWLVGGLSRNPPGVLSLTQENLRTFSRQFLEESAPTPRPQTSVRGSQNLP